MPNIGLCPQPYYIITDFIPNVHFTISICICVKLPSGLVCQVELLVFLFSYSCYMFGPS